MTTALDLPEILQVLRESVANGLVPDRLHIYIYDSGSNQFVATKGDDDRPTSDISFTTTSPLIEILKGEHLPFYVDPASPPESLQKESSRLALLGAYLFVSLRSGNQLMGWLALGLRRSGEPYSSHELSFLENISDQAAIAIERAQVVIDMQRRVREMNALTRVSQGVSITLSFDDVLELIFAQTTQIIPATDFHITLHNKEGGYFYYAFRLEDGRRLTELEDQPLPTNQGLAQWVAEHGRAVLTQDYMHECQSVNVIPAQQEMYAWAGVPLNAGSEAIGSLSVGSRDPNTTYTKAQLDLLQAIADQTAGAIIKARLLRETERRARQLSTLNEITRQLTSTLELEPLLQNILENAVGILNSEAGSLFMVDEDTDELVFAVTVGPVADNLVGKRLPAGSGIAGKAVETHAPVVENNVQDAAGWADETDEQTGFVTKSLLAVPLQVKEQVIGVVEVINRRDGLPFAEDDQELLSAFAGQAAVAVDNARLYTLTDQELNDRVEELTIMQRIDRELNASLEIDRAMRITLEWAMRQSASEAGLIGMLREDGVQIMAQQGYGGQLSLYEDTPLPLEMSSMIAASESGLPQRVSLDPAIEGGLLPGTRTQLVIPIRREGKVIGLILLESVSDNQADIGFLGRLSDHAAIAISNAQLYAEVEAANIAKSDFVSFVAHELKNPMTSIKGYTELLAAGAVGEISESQANFLSTIRSNVIRMSTLVSDLNDNSKIEAGRLRMDFKANDVAEIVENVIRSTNKQLEDKKQTVTVDLPEKLPKIWADNTRIEQVMVNLVSNSHKYTQEEGQIFIGAEATENKWDDQGAPQVVHIWVKDNGIGMTEEDQKKVFTKFFRSDDQKAREAPGTGLGLNITKSIVELQGGRIWFESKFREGTTFHITIPVAEK
ncbi:MAG: GAF domain-containing protein [Anaerolineales bacterium]|nr:GAF domain-containing protein [Anaerolineales bacterium]